MALCGPRSLSAPPEPSAPTGCRAVLDIKMSRTGEAQPDQERWRSQPVKRNPWNSPIHNPNQPRKGGGAPPSLSTPIRSSTPRPHLVVLVSIALFLPGCRSAHAGQPAIDLAAARQAIYTHALVNFDRAALCKPKPDDADASAADLAPIFVLQLPAAPATFPPCPKRTPAETETRSIYSAATTAHLSGTQYPQRVFVWWSAPREKQPSTWRALRVTFNHQDFPVVWEVIDQTAPIVQIYVARSIEQKAIDKYNEPLPGRRFVIEQSIDQRPQVVVARVLDDGPVPMGPMVYLRADADVATVICRCMPSQVADIEDTSYYNLHPLEDACAVTFDQLLATVATESPLFADLVDADWLERALRIDAGL